MPFLAWASIAALAWELDQRFCMYLVLPDSVVLSEAKDLGAQHRAVERLGPSLRSGRQRLLTRLQLRDRLRHHRLLVPGEEDPGVLAHLGDEGVDRRPARGFRIDRGEMRLGQQRADGLCGDAGIDQVV